MYVIDVIPLSRTAPGVLSYRSAEQLGLGAVVSILVRKTATQGIVVACTPVTEVKATLKTARFTLSRSATHAVGKLPEELLEAARETALYHGTTIGAVLQSLLSEHIQLGVPIAMQSCSVGSGYTHIPQEMPLAARSEIYQSYIDDAVAHKQSVLLVVPTLAELAWWKDAYKHYDPLILSGAVPSKKRSDVLERASRHEGLIIATPSFSWTPIERLAAIIIDRPSAGTYVLLKRPYVSVVRACQFLARARAIPLVLGDFPLPLEYRATEQETLVIPTSITVIDGRVNPDEQNQGSSWQVFPPAIISRIQDAITEGRSVIALTSRKGYAPSVVCRDCGQAQVDERGVPLLFTKASGKPVFTTSDGMTTIPAKRVCDRCGSWNLVPLGVGVERVEEELRKSFPTTPLYSFTDEHVLRPAKIRKLLAEHNNAPGILVGTEALLPWVYLHSFTKEPLGVIASADSLLSLPFWRSRERFLRLVLLFSGLVYELCVATRRMEDSVVQSLVTHDSSHFYSEEFELRKVLQYPPFGTVITITAEGGRTAVENAMADLMALMKAYTPTLMTSRARTHVTVAQTAVVLRSKGQWPDEQLSLMLASLPPTYRVRIDPESV